MNGSRTALLQEQSHVKHVATSEGVNARRMKRAGTGGESKTFYKEALDKQRDAEKSKDVHISVPPPITTGTASSLCFLMPVPESAAQSRQPRPRPGDQVFVEQQPG